MLPPLLDLYVRDGAWRAIVAFVVLVGALCVVQLWWLWFSLWPRDCCGKAARDCRCLR